MRNVVISALWLSIWFVGCGEDDRPTAPEQTGGGALHPGGVKPGAGATAGGEAGETAGGRSGSGGASHQGGAADSPGLGGQPPVAEPLCDPLGSFGEPEAQRIAEGTAVRLLSVALDEKSVAYVAGEAGAEALFVADREAPEAPFESGHAVTLPDGYEFESGATLSADGLGLVLVKADHSGFGQLLRSSRAEAFDGAVDEAPFEELNALKLITGNSLGWPLLSADGATLYFVSYQLASRVLEAHRDGEGAFDFGMVIDEHALGGEEAGAFKLLTGIAADQRAIFFFDEATGHSAALFRSRPQAPFYDSVDLGERYGLGPNADCTRVYSTDASGLVRQARD